MILFALSTAFTSAIGAAFAADMRTPGVTVLGAGSRVSVLITAGAARLLLATGDDPVALGNGLDLARHPTTRRLDVLLVAGQSRDLQAPAAIVESEHARFMARIGSPSDRSLPPSLQGLPILPVERRFRLPDDVEILVRWESGDDNDAAPMWVAVISHANSSIAVLSEGRAATLLGSVAVVNAVIVAGGEPLDALRSVSTGAIVTTDTAVTGKDLRQSAAAIAGDDLWGVRVYPGEAVRCTFTDGAVNLPPDAGQQLTGSTVGQPSPTTWPATDAADDPVEVRTLRPASFP